MLILTRRRQEKLTLTNQNTGETIEIMVADIKGNQVRVGIAAPKHIAIARNELLERNHETSY